MGVKKAICNQWLTVNKGVMQPHVFTSGQKDYAGLPRLLCGDVVWTMQAHFRGPLDGAISRKGIHGSTL